MEFDWLNWNSSLSGSENIVALPFLCSRGHTHAYFVGLLPVVVFQRGRDSEWFQRRRTKPCPIRLRWWAVPLTLFYVFHSALVFCYRRRKRKVAGKKPARKRWQRRDERCMYLRVCLCFERQQERRGRSIRGYPIRGTRSRGTKIPFTAWYISLRKNRLGE